MGEKKRWKIVMEYMAGIFILAAVVVIAWFLPEWYTGWQDEQILQQVTLSSREDIQFLDVDSLDLASRMKMLGEAPDEGWINYDILVDFSEKMEECTNTIKLWIKSGLLPAWIGTIVQEQAVGYFNTFAVYKEQKMLPLCVARFWSSNTDDLVTIVMDGEIDAVYYVSFSGDAAAEFMAQSLGYQSWRDMRRHVWEKEGMVYPESDYSSVDFAAVCGAESASVTGKEGLEFDVNLQFDSFEGHAYRRIIYSDSGYGMSIAFGTETGGIELNGMLAMDGYTEYLSSMEEWIAYGMEEEEFRDSTAEERAKINQEMKYAEEMYGENLAVD